MTPVAPAEPPPPDQARREKPAVRLGTVAAVGFDEFPPKEWLGCFRRLGCRAVQVYRNPRVRLGIERIKDALADGQMPCDSLHGLFGEAYDPSAPSEHARRAAVDTFKGEGELALALGGPLVVVHCSTIRRHGVSPERRHRRVEQLRKSIADLGAFGQRMGVRYAFENLPGYHPIGSDVTELRRILDDVAAPATGMCFDTGHAHMVGDAADAARQADGQMIYVHLSDNSGTADGHEMPTYGTLDCRAVATALNEANYRGTITLEAFRSVRRLEEMIDDGLAERLAEIVSLVEGA